MARMFQRAATVPAGGRQWTRAAAQWWQRLALRERVLLGLMLLAIVGAGLWVGWWEPLAKQRMHWQEELPRLQAQSQALEPLLQARRLQRDAVPTTAADLRAQLQANGLAAQVELEERDGCWHLQVRDVPADALWNWLLPVLADPAVPLRELTLERTGDANMAAARVSGSIVMGGGDAGGTP
ncbi:type II secretion system protein GspM [Stenotrophomonas tumulicola]|nr:type II secretion system protein GspM [Stenotrophomonas tumulicola]